jgi:hypothetical protein
LPRASRTGPEPSGGRPSRAFFESSSATLGSGVAPVVPNRNEGRKGGRRKSPHCERGQAQRNKQSEHRYTSILMSPLPRQTGLWRIATSWSLPSRSLRCWAGVASARVSEAPIIRYRRHPWAFLSLLRQTKPPIRRRMYCLRR